jgi:hypothetical protein
VILAPEKGRTVLRHLRLQDDKVRKCIIANAVHYVSGNCNYAELFLVRTPCVCGVVVLTFIRTWFKNCITIIF